MIKAKTTVHGMVNTSTYNSWRAMVARCYNPNHQKFSYYGGRGIKVCRSWKRRFMSFYEDMGERPEGKTLDRIDTNKNYKPDNCRWATPVEQRANRRDCKEQGHIK